MLRDIQLLFAELLTWWQHPEDLTAGHLDTGFRSFPLSSSIYGDCSEVSNCCESSSCSLPDLNSSKLIPFLRIQYHGFLSELGSSAFIGKSKFPSPYFELIFLTIPTPLFHIIPVRRMRGRRLSTSEQSEVPFLHLLFLELKGVSLLPRPSISSMVVKFLPFFFLSPFWKFFAIVTSFLTYI